MSLQGPVGGHGQQTRLGLILWPVFAKPKVPGLTVIICLDLDTQKNLKGSLLLELSRT